MKKFIILTIVIMMVAFSASQASMVKDLNTEIDVFEKEIVTINDIINQLNDVKTQELGKANIRAKSGWLDLNKKVEHIKKYTLKKIKLLIIQCKEITGEEWLRDKRSIGKHLKKIRRLQTVLKNYQAILDWIQEIKTSEVPEPRRARSK